MQQCCNLALAKKYSTTSSRPSCPLHVSDKSRSGRHMIGLDSRRRCKPLETKLLEAARANLVSLSLWFVYWNSSLAASSNGVFPCISWNPRRQRLQESYKHHKDVPSWLQCQERLSMGFHPWPQNHHQTNIKHAAHHCYLPHRRRLHVKNAKFLQSTTSGCQYRRQINPENAMNYHKLMIAHV